MVTKHPETQAIIEDAIFKSSCIVSWAISRLTSVAWVLEASALTSMSSDFLQITPVTSVQDLGESWMPRGRGGTVTPDGTLRASVTMWMKSLG